MVTPYYAYHGFMFPGMSDEGDLWYDHPTKSGEMVYSIITPIICFMGICGNILSLMVLMRRELKGSIYVYLTVLAVTDLVSSILLMMSGITCGGLLYFGDWPIYDTIIGLPLSGVMNSISVVAILAVTLDRCLCLGNPLRHKKHKFCTVEVARRAMFLNFIGSVVFNLPGFFIFAVDDYGQLLTLDFFYSNFYIVYNWIRFVLFGAIPTVILIIGNGFLIYSLHRLKKIKAKCNQSVKCRKRLACTNMTVVLILIVFFFIITEIPSLVISRSTSVSFITDEHGKVCHTKSLETWREVTTVVNALSYAVNFILFYMFCPTFCKVLAKLFRKNKAQHPKTVQMNVFVLDNNQIRLSQQKGGASINGMTTGKIFEMMDENNRYSFPSSLDDEEGFTDDRSIELANRKTMIIPLS